MCEGARTLSYGPDDTGIVCGSGASAFDIFDQGIHNQLAGRPGHFITVNDPAGAMGTAAEGISNTGTITGFYTDDSGNNHGFTLTPAPRGSAAGGPFGVGEGGGLLDIERMFEHCQKNWTPRRQWSALRRPNKDRAAADRSQPERSCACITKCHYVIP